MEKLSDIHDITKSYYECWLGEPDCLSTENELSFIYSKERNVKQIGYPKCLDLYIWLEENKRIVSYGDAAKTKIDEVAEIMSSKQNVSDMIDALSKVYECKVEHLVKYKFETHNHIDANPSVTLTADDYQDYENFFCACHPNVKNIDWLREYFNDMVQSGYCVAIYEDDRIVCCTDAPDMPYMSNRVQEIGVNTLPGYRGRGHGVAVCSKATENIVSLNKAPQWSTSMTNIPSQKLAERVGFIKMADVLLVTL